MFGAPGEYTSVSETYNGVVLTVRCWPSLDGRKAVICPEVDDGAYCLLDDRKMVAWSRAATYVEPMMALARAYADRWVVGR